MDPIRSPRQEAPSTRTVEGDRAAPRPSLALPLDRAIAATKPTASDEIRAMLRRPQPPPADPLSFAPRPSASEPGRLLGEAPPPGGVPGSRTAPRMLDPIGDGSFTVKIDGTLAPDYAPRSAELTTGVRLGPASGSAAVGTEGVVVLGLPLK